MCIAWLVEMYMDRNKELNRNVSIDIAKGIGIILMVVGHSSVPDYIRHYIYIYHMPLFFIVAGYLFNYEKWKGKIFKFSKKKAERLIIPYLFMSIFIFFPLWYVASLKFPQFSTHNVAKPTNVFMDIFYATFVGDGMAFNSPLWFLPCLFVAEMIFFLVLALVNNNIKRCVVVCTLSLIGYFIKWMNLPWSIDIALVVLVFLMMGYLIKDCYMRIRYLPGLLLILFFINEVNSVDVAHRDYGNILYFYIGGVVGTLATFQVSRFILYNIQWGTKLISYLGRNSMAILMWHGWCLKIISAIAAYMLHLSFFETKVLLWPGICFCAILLSIVILWVKNIIKNRFNRQSVIYKMLEW